MSRDTGAELVDNDNNFLFRDGSCDTPAFKSDGICLSANGLEKLMNNLSLRHLSHRDVGTIQQGEADWQQVFETTTEDVVWSSLVSRRPVTQTCRHVNAVSCFVCGQKGHKSKHHVNMD